MTRPWTPGPWEWLKPYPDYPTTNLQSTYSVVGSVHESHGGGRMPDDADAQLIALAPEMAEAILMVDTPDREEAIMGMVKKLGEIA